MGVTSLFMTTTRADSPLDGSGGTTPGPTVSDFLTVQSLTNFAAMTGAITAAWRALERLDPQVFSALWVPYTFAAVFALVSILISLAGLKKGDSSGFALGTVLGAIFVALINALVLASAVVGANVAARSVP